MIPAHTGQPLAHHDLWTAWNAHPLLIAGLVVTVWLYRSGLSRRRASDVKWRTRSFAAGLVALAVALLSPLDALSSELASAHMVQHLLLILVAAPLLVFSAPWPTLLRGTPLILRRLIARWRRRLRLTRARTRILSQPAVAWLSYVGTLWLWHAAVPYDFALRHQSMHILEHATFLITAILFWNVVAHALAGRLSAGFAMLFVFATSMQNVFLSALLTFSQTPWYTGYTATADEWGLTQLADQQLAGVIMWIPGGVVYLGTALTLLVTWIKQSERQSTRTVARADRLLAPLPGDRR